MTEQNKDAIAIEDLERLVTEDGSVTYRLKERDITYRSRFGAIEESRRVFLDPSGIREHDGDIWKVVELGFGVATNFRNTARFASEANLSLFYLAAEHAPIPSAAIEGDGVFDQMARDALDAARAKGYARVTHALTSEDNNREITITLVVRVLDWLEITPTLEPDFYPCHAIYYDPFGPRDDEESWSPRHLKHAAGWLEPTGRLMTYSVAGKVRRGLQSAGLWVATLPGHIKREVLVACADSATIDGLETLRSWAPKPDEEDQ